MLSSRPNRRIFLTGMLALAGCGYEPAFGPGGAGDSLLLQVAVAPPGNRNEFDFVTRLERRLGRPDVALFKLSYKISTKRDGVALTVGRDLFRYNLVGTASFTLRSVATGKVLTKSSVDTFTSYSIGFVDPTATPPSTSATIASVAAEEDAYLRLMTALADQVVNRLLISSPTWAK